MTILAMTLMVITKFHRHWCSVDEIATLGLDALYDVRNKALECGRYKHECGAVIIERLARLAVRHVAIQDFAQQLRAKTKNISL